MGQERRKLSRWAVICRVDLVDVHGRASVGLIKDLSPEGMFVDYAPGLRAGDKVRATFALPGRETVKLMARVLRLTPKGTGLQFVRTPEATQSQSRDSQEVYWTTLSEAWHEACLRGADGGPPEGNRWMSLKRSVPTEHPLRRIRAITDQTLRALSSEFSEIRSTIGRLAIAPEQLLRALLVQALYSIRSEPFLIEQLEYNVLFRWFVGLGSDEAAWDANVFSKNRGHLLRAPVARRFMIEVGALARLTGLLSDEHFSVDGTLLDGWLDLRKSSPFSQP